jgi:hypothetical protein
MSPRRINPKSKQESDGLPSWAKMLAVGVVVCLAAVGLYLFQTPQAPAPSSGSSSTSTSRTKGDPQAKIELMEYSDFQ